MKASDPLVRRLTLYALVLITVGLWGSSFPLTKMALEWMGPSSIAFVRWAITTLLMVGWLVTAGRLHAIAGLWCAEKRSVIWVGLTGITLFYALENLALKYTTAINAGVLSNLTTVFMVLIGMLWLHERLVTAEWVAVVMAFLGAVLVSQGAGHLTISSSGLGGDLLMVVATCFAAVYSVGGKRLVATYPPDIVLTAIAAAGTLFLLPLAIWEGLTLALPLTAWLILLVLGSGSGAVANLFWMQILSRMDASRAGMTLFLIPVFSTALAVLILHEPLTLTILGGAVLVLLGVAIVERARNIQQRSVRRVTHVRGTRL